MHIQLTSQKEKCAGIGHKNTFVYCCILDYMEIFWISSTKKEKKISKIKFITCKKNISFAFLIAGQKNILSRLHWQLSCSHCLTFVLPDFLLTS